MTLREKLIHYTNDLGNVDLKQEAIATIEHIAQYMDEDELLHHSRPLALAYLALTEDASVAAKEDCCSEKEVGYNYYPNCGCRMDGEFKDEIEVKENEIKKDCGKCLRKCFMNMPSG